MPMSDEDCALPPKIGTELCDKSITLSIDNHFLTYNDNFDGIIAKDYEDAVKINVECQGDKFYLKLEDGPGTGYHFRIVSGVVTGVVLFHVFGHIRSLVSGLVLSVVYKIVTFDRLYFV